MSALLAGTAIVGSHCSEAGVSTHSLWGFADLHAHLAFHLAYGADPSGANPGVGIMYGLPGMALDTANVQQDLAPCDGDKHGSSNPIANVLLTQLAQVLGTPHGSAGFPSFDNWPLATAGLHQQMHVTWLKRAYDGGQRLMVASAVENALLASVFSGEITSPGGVAIHSHEHDAVIAQLHFIKNFALANATWLEVVTTGAAAETVIGSGKMALVLGTEVDTLTADDIADLFQKEDVRVFIPIHLADNTLGGTAVYEDMFNIHNAYVNDTGYTVQTDKHLDFALTLNLSPMKVLGLPLLSPDNPANDNVLPGHRNTKGLSQAGKDAIKRMVDLGAIIDVAHMSEASIKDTLDIVEPLGVPVMDSHTGVRTPSERGFSERDLRFDAAIRIGKLGGMIGLGTGGITAQHDATPARTFYNGPFAPLTVATPTHTEQMPAPQPPTACKGLALAITTGDDDLRGGSSATLDIIPSTSTKTHDLAHGLQFDNGTLLKTLVPLPDGTLASQVGATLHHDTDHGFLKSDDKWNVAHITMTCGVHAFEATGAITIEPGKSYPVGVSTTDTSMANAVTADVWTGEHGLDGSSSIDIDVHSTSGTTTCTASPSGLGSKTLQRIQCTLPNAVAMNTIDTVSLHLTKSSGNWDVIAATVGLDDGTPLSPSFIDEPFAPLELKSVPLLLASPVVAQRMVRMTISTDWQGLARGVDATATFHFDSGPDQTIRLNKGAALNGGQIDAGLTAPIPIGSTYQFYVILTEDRLSSNIQSLRIDAPSDWPITQVILEAFEEPVERWVAELDQATQALARSTDCFTTNILCGVALGTDLNGMAPGIPGTTLSPYDPNRPGEFALDYPFELGARPNVVGLLTTGSKTWDVMRDGIAHVGMLPDFLVAAAHAQHVDAARIVSTVFHSAGDFVRMWQNIERHRVQ